MITTELKDLIKDNKSVKILATIGENGVPHTAVKGSVFLNEEGNIEYLELLEVSQSYKNFTRSLWYDKKVSLSISGEKGVSFEIIGRPTKILVAGPIFEKHYVEVREKLGDVELAAVCIIQPEKVNNQSYFIKFQEQESLKPVFKHLDRLAR